jgi:DNA-binding CsgD family transcriptional regulator
MAVLSERDYLGILDAVREAALGTTDMPMPDAALLAIQGLFLVHTVVFFWGPPGDRLWRSVWSGGGSRKVSGRIREPIDSRRRQGPLPPVKVMGRAFTTSDLPNRRARNQLGPDEAGGWQLPIVATMEYWFEPPHGPIQGLALHTDRPTFSEHDGDVLNVLGSQLERLAHGRALAFRAQNSPAITRREAEVLHLVAEGRTNAQIATILGIAPTTVRTHNENAFVKLGVHTRAAAVVAAFSLEPSRPPTRPL